MKCCVCNEEYEKLSEEHIIPNVICGKLKSKNLICSKCNSRLGEQIDIVLQKSFAWIINLFSLEKERGNYIPIEAKINGRKCLLKHGFVAEYNDVVADLSKNSNGKLVLRFSAPPNKKILQTELPKFIAKNKLKLAEGGVDYKSLIKKVSSDIDNMTFSEMLVDVEYGNQMELKIKFCGNDLLLAILKICFMYACQEKIEFNRAPIIKLLTERTRVSNAFFFCGNEKIFSYKSPGVYHNLAINTSVDGKCLFVSVELFSLVTCVVLLDDNYQGEAINTSYGFNLIHRHNCIPNLKPIKSYDELEELCVENFANSKSLDQFRKNTQNLRDLLNKLFLPLIVKNAVLRENMIPKDLLEDFDKYFECMQDAWRTHFDQIASWPFSVLLQNFHALLFSSSNMLK